MAARCWRRLALVACVLGLLGGAQACVDDGVSLHVICPIHPNVDDDGCTWEADGETCVAEGVMNVAATTHYAMFLRVESGLMARSREVPPQGESSGIQIRSAEIELRDPSGGPYLLVERDETDKIIWSAPNPFTVLATGYIEPEGIGAVGLTIIDDNIGNFLFRQQSKLPQIVASIKLRGETNGAQRIKGGEFVWPIRLSNDGPEACFNGLDSCANMVGQDDFARACGASAN